MGKAGKRKEMVKDWCGKINVNKLHMYKLCWMDGYIYIWMDGYIYIFMYLW
jgi:hypothetical protein